MKNGVCPSRLSFTTKDEIYGYFVSVKYIYPNYASIVIVDQNESGLGYFYPGTGGGSGSFDIDRDYTNCFYLMKLKNNYGSSFKTEVGTFTFKREAERTDWGVLEDCKGYIYTCPVNTNFHSEVNLNDELRGTYSFKINVINIETSKKEILEASLSFFRKNNSVDIQTILSEIPSTIDLKRATTENVIESNGRPTDEVLDIIKPYIRDVTSFNYISLDFGSSKELLDISKIVIKLYQNYEVVGEKTIAVTYTDTNFNANDKNYVKSKCENLAFDLNNLEINVNDKSTPEDFIEKAYKNLINDNSINVKYIPNLGTWQYPDYKLSGCLEISKNNVVYFISVSSVKAIPFMLDTSTEIKLQDTSGVLSDNVKLSSTKITNQDTLNIVKNALNNVSTKYVVYDISLLDNSSKIQPSGKVKISIPVPDNMDISKIAVYRISDNGEKTEYKTTIEGEYATFETDHFSTYVLAEKLSSTNNNTGANSTEHKKDDTPKTGESTIINYLIAISIISFIAIIILRKRLKN